MHENGPFPFAEALAVLKERFPQPPEATIVLGSGLSGLADAVEDPVALPFDEVPGFPPVGVVGHAGRWVYGGLEGRRVLLQAGRFHFYEGYPPELIVAPVRLAAALGSRMLILTNAAGGIREDLEPGSLMLLDDHLNLMGRNPLVGPVHGSETRFPDLTSAYDEESRRRAGELAAELDVALSRGVYAGVLGPSYETPAEIRFLRGAGADAVGMSTVPEAIVGAALGIRVLGFSLITNKAAGEGESKLDHQEVLDMGRKAGGRLEKLIRAFVRGLP